MNHFNHEITKVSWAEVRDSVLALNPSLATIIDELSPSKELYFYRARYPFGSEIVKKGIVRFPVGDKYLSLADKDIPKEIQQDLSYNSGSNPATFVLNKRSELFIELPDRIIPIGIPGPGSFFGLSHILDGENSCYPEIGLWGLTAGGRSISLLPKVSEAIAHNRLCTKFGIHTDKPKDLTDQWHVFRELYNHADFGEEWSFDVLYWPKQWFEFNDDPAWLPFNYFLKNLFLANTSYSRNEYIWNLLYSRIHQARNIKPAAYIADIVKHLFAICTGAFPGFTVAEDDDLAPISKLKAVYEEFYGLKNYKAIFMQPEYFNYRRADKPIYFSLQHNTAVNLGMKSTNKATVLTNLYETQSLLEKYMEELLKGGLQLSISTLNEIIRGIQFNFFHSQPGHYRHIHATTELEKFDDRLKSPEGQLIYPATATFLNGCIQISKKA